jgi:mannonate dehydratase
MQETGAPDKGVMQVGWQNSSADEALRVLPTLGITHMCGEYPSPVKGETWTVEGLTRMRERVESHGMHLDMVELPLSSAYITKQEFPHIMLGKSPERDREIDQICEMIRSISRVGIPATKYNLTILGCSSASPKESCESRTGYTRGRGGALYSTFVFEKLPRNLPLTEAGLVSEEMMWDRITYFLKRVVPVAEEYKVKIACHPHDPPMPRDTGFRGVHTVLGSVEGLKRFIEIMPSKYHGLNFCQGSVCEGLENPASEIFDVIRYFGPRGKIFNVHFRNIRGHFLNFEETFPDDGDVNMIHAMRVYKEVGYNGMMMPDHVPIIEGDENQARAFVYAYGYIQALIQMVS